VTDEQVRSWEVAVAAPRSAPGVTSMLGYRALEVCEGVHRGMPSSTLTCIVSLDDGVESADTADALAVARPTALILGGLQLWLEHTAITADPTTQRPDRSADRSWATSAGPVSHAARIASVRRV
jgi:hypothetical protein